MERVTLYITKCNINKRKTGSKKTNNANVSITAPVTQTENCGDQGCFEKKFTECKPVTLTAGFGEDIKTTSVVVYYKINGPKGNGCNMLFSYTKNPNPDWENKDSTCNWDNKKAFQDSIEQTFNNLDGNALEELANAKFANGTFTERTNILMAIGQNPAPDKIKRASVEALMSYRHSLVAEVRTSLNL